MSRIAAVLVAIFMSATALAQEALPARTMGSGDTQIVLIPGLAADWRVWEGFIERNSDAYTMHAVALPGFGEVDMPELNGSETPAIDASVAGVIAMMDEKGLDEAVVMGHGALGSFITMRVAIEHPDRVSKAITVDGLLPSMPLGPSGIMSGPQREALAAQLSPMLREQLTEDQWEEMKSGSEQSITPEGEAALAEIYAGAELGVGQQYLSEMILVDVAAELKDLDCPVLAIYAVDQPENGASPLAQSKLQSRSIMRDSFRASTAVFQDSRAWLMRDRAKSFDETIQTFLRGLPVSDVVVSDE